MSNLTASELAKLILCSEYEQIGEGAGRSIRRWSTNECKLAEHIEKLESKLKKVSSQNKGNKNEH